MLRMLIILKHIRIKMQWQPVTPTMINFDARKSFYVLWWRFQKIRHLTRSWLRWYTLGATDKLILSNWLFNFKQTQCAISAFWASTINDFTYFSASPPVWYISKPRKRKGLVIQLFVFGSEVILKQGFHLSENKYTKWKKKRTKLTNVWNLTRTR
jgi:hypothetical protein